LVALLYEGFDELEYAGEVELLLFFLLTLEGTLGAVNILSPHHTPLFSLVAVPPADVLDGLDGGELAVGNVDVVGDAHEGLVHVGDREEFDASGLDAGLVDFADLLVKTCDFWVEQDDCNDLEGDQGRDVLYGVVVLVHADIGQQVDEMQEVVPLGHPILEVLGNGTEILLV
jgi:hypothetical protein